MGGIPAASQHAPLQSYGRSLCQPPVPRVDLDAGGFQRSGAERFAESVHNSISAVESVARRIAPGSKTLGIALNELEKRGPIDNSPLKAGFEKVYAYTNSGEGIRHAQVFSESSNVGMDEAMFMFGSCAAFATFLVSKHRAMQESEDQR